MKEFVCIVCPNGCRLRAEEKDGTIEVSGNLCRRGAEFARHEMTDPTRTLTTTVHIRSALQAMLPVRTDGELPKAMLFDAMRALRGVEVSAPVKCGDTVVRGLLGTDVNLIATETIEK